MSIISELMAKSRSIPEDIQRILDVPRRTGEALIFRHT